MTRNNCQINSKLKECNLKLLEKSIALGSAVWAITQCHKYTNERIKDLDPVSYTHLTLPTILRV